MLIRRLLKRQAGNPQTNTVQPNLVQPATFSISTVPDFACQLTATGEFHDNDEITPFNNRDIIRQNIQRNLPDFFSQTSLESNKKLNLTRLFNNLNGNPPLSTRPLYVIIESIIQSGTLDTKTLEQWFDFACYIATQELFDKQDKQLHPVIRNVLNVPILLGSGTFGLFLDYLYQQFQRKIISTQLIKSYLQNVVFYQVVIEAVKENVDVSEVLNTKNQLAHDVQTAIAQLINRTDPYLENQGNSSQSTTFIDFETAGHRLIVAYYTDQITNQYLRQHVEATLISGFKRDEQISNVLGLLIYDAERKLDNTDARTDSARNLLGKIKATKHDQPLKMQYLGQQYIRLVVLISSLLEQNSNLEPAIELFNHLNNLALAIDHISNQEHLEEDIITILNYIKFEYDIPSHIFLGMIGILHNNNSLCSPQTLNYIKFIKQFRILESKCYANKDENGTGELVIDYINEWLANSSTVKNYGKLATLLEKLNSDNNFELIHKSFLEEDLLGTALEQLAAALKFYDGNLVEFNKGTIAAHNILLHIREIFSNNIAFPPRKLIKILKSVQQFIENPLQLEPLYIPQRLGGTKLGQLLNDLKQTKDYEELGDHILPTIKRLNKPLKGTLTILGDLRYGRGVTFDGHSFELSPEFKKFNVQSETSCINALKAFFNRLYFDNQNLLAAKNAVDKFLRLYTQIGVVPELMDSLGNVRQKEMRHSSLDFHVNEEGHMVLTITEVTGISNLEDMKVPGTITTVINFDEKHPTLQRITPSNPCLKLLYTRENCAQVLQTPQGQRALFTAYQTELRDTIQIIDNVRHDSNLKPAAKQISDQLKRLINMKGPLQVRLVSIIKLCFLYPGNITWLSKLNHLAEEMDYTEMATVLKTYLKQYGYPLRHNEIKLLIKIQQSFAKLVFTSSLTHLGAIPVEDLHNTIRFRLYLLEQLDQSHDAYILDPTADLLTRINAIEAEISNLPSIPWMDYLLTGPNPSEKQITTEQAQEIASEQAQLNQSYQPSHLQIKDYIQALRVNNLTKFFGITTFIHLKYNKLYNNVIDRELFHQLLIKELSANKLDEDDLLTIQRLSLFDLTSGDRSVLVAVLNASVGLNDIEATHFNEIDSKKELINDVSLMWAYFERVLTQRYTDAVEDFGTLKILAQKLLSFSNLEIVKQQFNLFSDKYSDDFEIICRLNQLRIYLAIPLETPSLRSNVIQGTQFVAKLPVQAASLTVNAIAHPVQTAVTSSRLVAGGARAVFNGAITLSSTGLRFLSGTLNQNNPSGTGEGTPRNTNPNPQRQDNSRN